MARAPRPARILASTPAETATRRILRLWVAQSFSSAISTLTFALPDAEKASRSTLDTSMLLGLDVLCDGRRAFINCTREVLLKDYVMLLPANQTIVEVLEDVELDDLVTGCLRALERSRIHDRARRLRP